MISSSLTIRPFRRREYIQSGMNGFLNSLQKGWTPPPPAPFFESFPEIRLGDFFQLRLPPSGRGDFDGRLKNIYNFCH